MATGLLAATANTMLDTLTPAHVALHVGDPGAAGTSSPSAVTTRMAATMAAAAAGSKALSSAVGPWTGTTTETLSHISVWSASTGGSCRFTAALTASKAWASGDTFQITSMTVSFTPLAA